MKIVPFSGQSNKSANDVTLHSLISSSTLPKEQQSFFSGTSTSKNSLAYFHPVQFAGLADLEPGEFPGPNDIYDELDKYVAGNKRAKRILSTIAYQHLRRQDCFVQEEATLKTLQDYFNFDYPSKRAQRLVEALTVKMNDNKDRGANNEEFKGEISDTLEEFVQQPPKHPNDNRILGFKTFAQMSMPEEDKPQNRTMSPAFVKRFIRRLRNNNTVIIHDRQKNMVSPEKKNVLLIGDTGTGKTHLARAMHRAVTSFVGNSEDIPFVTFNAGNLSEAGYVGGDIEALGIQIWEASGYNMERAERAIVYIDEIDKKKKQSDGRDVSGEGAISSLLTLLEDGQLTFTYKNGTDNHEITIDMKDIQFILGGAFTDLKEIVHKDLYPSRLGFHVDAQTLDKDNLVLSEKNVQPKHLEAYGMTPEFIGRMNNVAFTEPLDKKTLLYILQEIEDSPLKQLQGIFQRDGISLEFSPQALEVIAEEAEKDGTGARALKLKLEQVTEDHQFNVKKYKRQEKYTVSIDAREVCEKLDIPIPEEKETLGTQTDHEATQPDSSPNTLKKANA